MGIDHPIGTTIIIKVFDRFNFFAPKKGRRNVDTMMGGRREEECQPQDGAIMAETNCLIKYEGLAVCLAWLARWPLGRRGGSIPPLAQCLCQKFGGAWPFL